MFLLLFYGLSDWNKDGMIDWKSVNLLSKSSKRDNPESNAECSLADGKGTRGTAKGRRKEGVKGKREGEGRETGIEREGREGPRKNLWPPFGPQLWNPGAATACSGLCCVKSADANKIVQSRRYTFNHPNGAHDAPQTEI